MNNRRLLSVNHLTVNFNSRRNGTTKTLLDDISFNVFADQCVGIVGESGSGKSLTCQAIMGLLEPNFSIKGEINFKGQSLLTDKSLIQQIRGKSICMILQHPMSAFNPLYKIGSHIVETLQAHKKISKKEAINNAVNMLEQMQFSSPYEVLNKYPHQLSGGMLQRIMIGIALLLKPDLIIADEPTTALDSITQHSMLKAFEQIRQQYGTAMIFISHDLGVINYIADHVIVMNRGNIVEQGKRENIFKQPQHEYTQYLINTHKQLHTRFNQMNQVN